MAKRRRHHPKQKSRRRWKSRIVTSVTLAGLGVAIVVLGLYAFTGGDDGPRQGGAQTAVVSDEPQVTVDVEDNFFEPDNLTVRVGTEITWVFKGDAAHDVTDAGGAFASEIMSSGEFVHVFDEAGTYYYYCTLHHVMQAELTVQP